MLQLISKASTPLLLICRQNSNVDYVKPIHCNILLLRIGIVIIPENCCRNITTIQINNGFKYSLNKTKYIIPKVSHNKKVVKRNILYKVFQYFSYGPFIKYFPIEININT